MVFNIVLTTAEDIVAATDAVLAKPEYCTEEFISDFTDLTNEQVCNALGMCMQLGLVEYNENSNEYFSNSPLARLLICANNDMHKAAIMRVILEQYAPFIDFKSRFMFTQAVDLAARQIQVIYNMQSNHRDIKNTIISLATYAKALVSQGANLYRFNEKDLSYIDILNDVIEIKSSNESLVIRELGDSAYNYINKELVFNPLSDSFSKIINVTNDARATINYAGNAFESFLSQIGADKNISLVGKTGIIKKADALSTVLSKKHRGMISYIGQVRNAADHGIDIDENGQAWNVSCLTATTYPILVASLIKNIVEYLNGNLIV